MPMLQWPTAKALKWPAVRWGLGAPWHEHWQPVLPKPWEGLSATQNPRTVLRPAALPQPPVGGASLQQVPGHRLLGLSLPWSGIKWVHVLACSSSARTLLWQPMLPVRPLLVRLTARLSLTMLAASPAASTDLSRQPVAGVCAWEMITWRARMWRSHGAASLPSFQTWPRTRRLAAPRVPAAAWPLWVRPVRRRGGRRSARVEASICHRRQQHRWVCRPGSLRILLRPTGSGTQESRRRTHGASAIGEALVRVYIVIGIVDRPSSVDEAAAAEMLAAPSLRNLGERAEVAA
mmetsp:Transcript_55885/g.142136  ORF Transcript_55885/g.142136 Transcript_55885/m.142136 type:complete len:291 (+) Transcript_55885:876-1748(+)